MSDYLEKEAPISRKRRLMAAIGSGEECAGAAAGSSSSSSSSSCAAESLAAGAASVSLPSSSSSSSSSGVALCCFICGGGISRGKELKLQVKSPRDHQPFFPFLQHQEPAPGAQEVTPEGCALVCAVCRCFLAEQWDAFERTRTPVEKRMYWLKRPYQCDGPGGPGGLRRVTQEWNLSYALGANDDERRPSSSSGRSQPPEDEEGEAAGRAGGEDTDLSSLSDAAENLSDSDLRPPSRDNRAQAGAGSCSARERTVVGSAPMSSRESYRGWNPPLPPPAESAAVPLRPGNGLPLAEKPRKKRQRRARLWGADALVWKAAPGAPLGSSAKAPPGISPDLGRSDRSAAKRPSEEEEEEERVREPPGYGSSEESEINITSDEEQKEEARGLPAPRPPRGTASSSWSPSGESLCCYVCGSLLTPSSQHRIHVQKQEKASKAPFFPFLWLHSPPPGALPISPAGSTLVCSCCFASLMQQWQSFELAHVPVLQRLYVVPLNAANARKRETPPRDEPLPPHRPVFQEACYLCGEDCTKDPRLVVSAKIPNGNAKTTMHFPLLGLLPCPPNAKVPNRHWEVQSCRKCYGVLQDLWAMYRASHNEEFITSAQSFLGRYHQVFSAEKESGHGSSRQASLAKAGLVSVCYICGGELGAGKEFQLSVNPPGRFGEKEPFFPFLTVYPPAPRARPADSTGIVATCVLCYHDLLGQWLQYESTSSHHPSSAWSRQYKVETFVCFFCRQEKKRCLGLKAVQVARLPIFLGSLRVPSSLSVDDGKQLTLGACAECAVLVLAGKTAGPRDLVPAPAMAPVSLPKIPY
ncbi:hypothetical protein JRQ81_006212 [Phrynocephalus forsythii]|uniref:Genetic suppressor element 1 n=1 Tax=Phrynocephalus forsythii TaxID=171643 RepID=A0A9Q1AUC1_9SAUR|nr:hypothetical protein JRQ81_006212 [Phrynocephalus forsythii]